MRVISGIYRRIVLETVPTNEVRPTNDRIKETLFNMISGDIIGCNFLDLFAGSGQMGIEALSRGAEHVTFVENNRKAFNCIKNNLTKIKAKDHFDLIFTDAFLWLTKPNKYDIIFIDPPYAMADQKKLVELIEENNTLNEDGIIIIEADKNNNTDFETNIFENYKTKIYKTNKHIFLRKKS